MWHRSFLLISGVVELLFLTPALLFIAFLGYHGFAAGEMGTMIGAFATAILLFLLPYLAARLAVVLGLKKDRRWATVLNGILSTALLVAAMLSIGDFPVISAALIVYAGVSIWAAVECWRQFGVRMTGNDPADDL